jgi:hypothetical protein
VVSIRESSALRHPALSKKGGKKPPVPPTRNKTGTFDVFELSRRELLEAVAERYTKGYQLRKSKDFAFTYQIIVTNKVPKCEPLTLPFMFMHLIHS